MNTARQDRKSKTATLTRLLSHEKLNVGFERFNVRCASNNQPMKKSIALVFAASTVFLASCCTTPPPTKWEYKVAHVPPPPEGFANVDPQAPRDRTQTFLNDLGKEGWVLVNEEGGRVFYFKRPIK
jgi:hypothetical protein